jgi:nucleoside-diphosphate-sugar epimerase
MAARVSRFIHVSSTAVLGADINGTGDESSPFRKERNPYNWSRIQAELLLQKAPFHAHAPVTVLRTGLLYGPRDTVSFGRLCTLIQKRKMRLIGSGHNHLPLIYVRDVAEAMFLACESPRTIGRTYNLVNDEPVTQQEYFAAIARELGVDAPHRHIPYRVALMMGAAA